MFDPFGIGALYKVLRLRKPGRVFLVLTNEEGDSMLSFVLVLPPASASDVIDREVTLQIGDGDVQTFNVAVSRNQTDEFSGKEGMEILGSLIDIDDADNRSEPRDFSFVLKDTIAPPKPGEVGLMVTSETDDNPIEPNPGD